MPMQNKIPIGSQIELQPALMKGLTNPERVGDTQNRANNLLWLAEESKTDTQRAEGPGSLTHEDVDGEAYMCITCKPINV